MAYIGLHSSEPKKKNDNKKIIIILCTVVLIFAGAFCFINGNPGEASASEIQTQEIGEKNVDTIDIPGYELLSFEAGKKKQSLCLFNPQQNTCGFIISLLLSDGTELWRSEQINPGETSKPIVFYNALEAGSYPNSVLKYECFRLDKEKTPLNGAETKLTIIVK